MRVKLFLGAAAVAAVACLSGLAHAQSKSSRPTVAIMDFDYGTVGYHWWGDYDIGKGMADQVVDALLEDGTFRVIERKKLDTILAEQDFAHSDRADPSAAKLSKLGKVLGVRYIIAGSITKFGGEEKNYGAGGFGGGKVGGLKFGGAGGGGGAGFSMSSSDYKASAIGEAQEAATKDLVAKIVAKKD